MAMQRVARGSASAAGSAWKLSLILDGADGRVALQCNVTPKVDRSSEAEHSETTRKKLVPYAMTDRVIVESSCPSVTRDDRADWRSVLNQRNGSERWSGQSGKCGMETLQSAFH
ncbi:hypothetical protein BU23DRAFT_167483 [Bimuria novae-zelandiae CBS 107.79]|uniref:Uncharacterized protein n=1 Tax=Bimuria novae-zelandiae CBS 107.79 TaxID=1447943 RepID=A0A6A5VF81_9PLEO|nr:hypothetical protein BU23DRAFT_167483 [Bimuria novae-zelandiae CBS 107.79]